MSGRAGRSAAVVAERMPVPVALQRHGAAWRALAARAEDATAAMHPAFVAAWDGVIAGPGVGSVILVHRGEALIGALAVMAEKVRRGPAMTPRIDYAAYDADLTPGTRRLFPVRQIASMVSWRAAAIRPATLCEAVDREAVCGAVARYLAGITRTDLIVLPVHEGREAELWLAAFRAAGMAPRIQRLHRNVLTLEAPDTFETIVAGQSRNFRRNVRRAREAAASGGLRFTLHEGWDAVRPCLADFAALAGRSWKAGEGHATRIAIPFEGAQRAFLERLAEDADPHLMPVLVMGHVAGGLVVAQFYLAHGGTLTAFLTFHDGSLPLASPGLLAIEPALDRAVARGLQRFDLNATQDWLRYLSDTSRTICNMLCFGPTLRGRLYRRIAQVRAMAAAPGTDQAGSV